MSVEVILPRFNMEMEEGTILRWLRHEEDAVREGDPLCEVETDKVAMEVEAPATGILCGLRASEGQNLPVTSVIAYIASDVAEAKRIGAETKRIGAESRPQPEQQEDGRGPSAEHPLAEPLPDSMAESAALGQPPTSQDAGELPSGPAAETGPTPPQPAGGDSPERVRASPAVRRRAKEHGINLAAVTDQGGRVSRSALEQAISRSAAAGKPPAAQPEMTSATATTAAPARPPAPSGGRPLDSTRSAIAARMTRAGQLPDITVEVEVRGRKWLAWRDHFRSEEKPSISALLAAAIGRALREHPLLNSTFENDLVSGHETVNLGIAVARPKGLIVPVLKGVEKLSLTALTEQARGLIEKARADRLTMDDVSGGTFTLSSLGEVGVDRFRALINPPQVAILAVGRIADRVVPIDGAIAVEPTLYLSLTCDHRVVDGEPAGQFIVTLKRLLEEPTWIGER